jgi:hypothetical protein
MANSLDGINLKVVAQDSLTTLLAEFPLIQKFTTNFSGDIANRGESVTTRIASPVTAGDVGSSGYVKTDVETTERVIALDKHKAFVMGFADGEVAKGGYDVLRRTFMRPAAHSVAKAVLNDIFGLCIAGSTGYNVVGTSGVGYNGTSAGFDADAVADLAQFLTDQDNPMAGRMLIVKPALFTALSKDVDIKAQYASGTNAPLTENLLPRIHGFEVNQYSALPDAGVTNQKGIFCTPEAILIASRLPATPTNWYGNVATATDEASGLSIQIREWYDGDLGQQKIAMTVLYGVSVGNNKALGRIIAS